MSYICKYTLLKSGEKYLGVSGGHKSPQGFYGDLA